MSSKTFLTISKKECLIVYKDILANSNKKWESGKHLSLIGDFSSATSMAIISIEEMVKALVVYLDGNGFEFRKVKGMDKVFNHHQIRYLIAYIMFVISLFGEDLIRFIETVRENPSEITKISEALKQNKDEFFEKNLKVYFLRKLVLLEREFSWFSQVDVFRQDGFYSNYEEHLTNPITISKYDYKQVFQRLEKVRKVGAEIITAFEIKDESVIENLKKVKIEFKQMKFYSHIEKSLAIIRQSRENPFDIVKSNFVSFENI